MSGGSDYTREAVAPGEPPATLASRRGRAGAIARTALADGRFLSPRMLACLGAYLFIALSFTEARVTNDGEVYYRFMQRLVGENVAGYAYQFGIVIWNLPFYLAGRLLGATLGRDSVGALPLGELSVAIAAHAAVLVIFYLSWRLLREFQLPARPEVILLTVFGTPLFYYAVFQPSYKHAVDTLAICLMFFLLLRAAESPRSLMLCVAIGAVLAISINVRYANVALLAGPLYLFLRSREFRAAYTVISVAVAGAALILAVPLLRGIPYGLPPEESIGAPHVQSVRTLASVAADPKPSSQDIVGGVQFDPLAPVKMLFTLERGLFLWTPLCFFGTIGFALLLRREIRQRRFLVALSISCLSLLLVHSLWGAFWTGGYSFSQRFLTGVFPLFLLGVGELIRRARWSVVPVLASCVAFAFVVAIYHRYGYDGVSERDGLDRIYEFFRSEETVGELWNDRIEQRIRDRWSAYADWASP